MKLFNRILLALGLFLGVTNIAMAGQPDQAPPPVKDHWQYLVAPYGWVFGQQGDITVKGRKAHVDIPLHKAFDLIKDIDFVLMVQLEARKGRWTLMADPTYLKVSPSATVAGKTITITSTFFLTHFGAYYALATSQFDNGNWIRWEALFGGRDFYLKNKLEITPISVSGDKNWIAPMIGGRAIMHLSPKFNAILHGDIAGVSREFSWALSLIGTYSFNQYVALGLGYRAFDFCYSGGASRNAIDILYHGPIAGVIFTW